LPFSPQLLVPFNSFTPPWPPTQLQIPFNSFTDFWDDATGEPIKPCASFPEYCPDAATLQDIRTLSFWAEGALGVVALEVRAVDAYGCVARLGEAMA
jgi:hypothetical protein